MTLSAEQRAIKDSLRTFALEEIRPRADEADRTQTFPTDLWDALAELDLTGLTVPERYGGIDVDPVTYSIVNEELAYGMLAVGTAVSVHALASACIRRFGSSSLKESWLPRLANGESIGAFALSEPHAGSNPRELSTTATYESDGSTGRYRLDGEKQWITNGQQADIFVVFAKVTRSDPDSITQFLVPADSAGLTVGEPEDKLGLRASDTTSLSFDGVTIPEKNRLTAEGAGLKAGLSVLTEGRIGIAAQAVGLAESALDLTLEYAEEREQFGGPIADIQTVRHRLATMATKVETARQLTRHAARCRERGDAVTEASMAKVVASEIAMAVTNDAVQLHGGYGYTVDFAVERLYRDAKVTEIYEGTTQIQKRIIADRVIG